MSQPNFLQVERGLAAAIRWCGQQRGTAASTAYGAALGAIAARFATVTAETDAAYVAWRRCYGAELGCFTELRRELERSRSLADEHGMELWPQPPMLYTERAELEEAARAALQALRHDASTWSWIPEVCASVERAISASASERRAAELAYGAYTVAVKGRVDAYTSSVALLREFAADCRRERGGAPLPELAWDAA